MCCVSFNCVGMSLNCGGEWSDLGAGAHHRSDGSDGSVGFDGSDDTCSNNDGGWVNALELLLFDVMVSAY